jgi:hypothetical protein
VVPRSRANDDLIGPANQLRTRFANDLFKRLVDTLDGVVGVEDQDAVRGGVEQRIEALFLVGDLPVKLRVVDRNRSLIGERLQEPPVVGENSR